MRVGQKVVCLYAVTNECDGRVYMVPSQDKVYTVRDIQTDRTWTGLHLEEIINTAPPGYKEPFFDIRIFGSIQ